MSTIEYRWPLYSLHHDTETGETATVYRDGKESRTRVIPDDRYHAERMEITPERHRLAHELGHHLTAIARRGDYSLRVPGDPERGCRIVYRAAHGHTQHPDEAADDEWKITGLTYFAFDCLENSDVQGAYFSSLDALRKEGVDVGWWARAFRNLLALADAATDQGETVLVEMHPKTSDETISWTVHFVGLAPIPVHLPAHSWPRAQET